MVALNEQEIQSRLSTLPGWAMEGTQLVRTFTFVSYADGVAFAVKVAMLSEKMDHHPDSLEVTWKKVRVAYLTHSAGGITDLDFDAAARVGKL